MAASTKPREDFIEANGLRFHTREWGEARSKHAVIMMHGTLKRAMFGSMLDQTLDVNSDLSHLIYEGMDKVATRVIRITVGQHRSKTSKH